MAPLVLLKCVVTPSLNVICQPHWFSHVAGGSMFLIWEFDEEKAKKLWFWFTSFVFGNVQGWLVKNQPPPLYGIKELELLWIEMCTSIH